LLNEVRFFPSEGPFTTQSLCTPFILNGRERTEPEFRQLLEVSGWKFSRIIPTRAGDSIVEGVAWQPRPRVDCFVPGMALSIGGFAAAEDSGPTGSGTDYFAPRTFFRFGANSNCF